MERRGSGCGARVVDQRTPGGPNPVRQVHAVPDLDESRAVDEPRDVVEAAFDEDDPVKVPAAVEVGNVPTDLARVRA
jgi:hypothetical protein